MRQDHDKYLVMEYIYKYPRPAVTADCLLFAKEADDMYVLLIKRKNPPYKNCWAFPGGFLEMNETLEECAARELKEETGVEVDAERLMQIGTYSRVDRDPRDRVISTAYSVFVNKDKIIDPKGYDDAAEAKWFNVRELPELAFDHRQILEDALVMI